jgi:hypothetical protein
MKAADSNLTDLRLVTSFIPKQQPCPAPVRKPITHANSQTEIYDPSLIYHGDFVQMASNPHRALVNLLHYLGSNLGQ